MSASNLRVGLGRASAGEEILLPGRKHHRGGEVFQYDLSSTLRAGRPHGPELSVEKFVMAPARWPVDRLGVIGDFQVLGKAVLRVAVPDRQSAPACGYRTDCVRQSVRPACPPALGPSPSPRPRPAVPAQGQRARETAELVIAASLRVGAGRDSESREAQQDLAGTTRRPAPMTELFSLQDQFATQIAAEPSTTAVNIRVV